MRVDTSGQWPPFAREIRAAIRAAGERGVHRTQLAELARRLDVSAEEVERAIAMLVPHSGLMWHGSRVVCVGGSDE